MLDDYAGDPALMFVPDGAERDHPIARQRGCLRLDKEDVSRTSVETSFTLTRDYDQDALLAAYGPVLTDHGWAPDEIRQAELGPNAGQPFLAYCRVVRGVTTELSISANPATRYDVRPSGPNRPPSPSGRRRPVSSSSSSRRRRSGRTARTQPLRETAPQSGRRRRL